MTKQGVLIAVSNNKMTYTITLTLSVEAENEDKAYVQVKDLTLNELNNGDNLEIEAKEVIDYSPF